MHLLSLALQTWQIAPQPKYHGSMQRVDDAWDALYVPTLYEHGEHGMAQLFQGDRAQFEQQYEAGRQCFHGAESGEVLEDDEWLDSLLEAVGGCLEADRPMEPLGLRFHAEEGFWQVWSYPSPVELVGGRHDGEAVAPGFTLHLEELHACFQSVADFRWNALGLNYPERPHVSIEGVFRGREVYFQVLACAPEGEEPGLKVNATRHRRRDE
jgi:hypothetical protein